MLVITCIFISCMISESKPLQFASERQLLIFGKENNSKLLKEQKEILEKVNDGVKERDLKTTFLDKGDPLCKTYRVKAGEFTVVLVGKDGMEKHRTDKLLTAEELFSIIDSMPMRKAEMRKKG